jgi:hypothetical protein
MSEGSSAELVCRDPKRRDALALAAPPCWEQPCADVVPRNPGVMNLRDSLGDATLSPDSRCPSLKVLVNGDFAVPLWHSPLASANNRDVTPEDDGLS